MFELIPHIIFNTTIIFGTVAILISRSKLGVLELSFAGLCVYSLPLIFNHLIVTNYNYNATILPETFFVMGIPLVTLTLFICYNTYQSITHPTEPSSTIVETPSVSSMPLYISFLLLTAIMVWNITDILPLDEEISKKHVSQKVSLEASLFIRNFLISFCASFAMLKRNYPLLFTIAIYSILIAVLFHTRSALVFFAICSSIAWASTTQLPFKKIKVYCGSLGAFLFLLVVIYKRINFRLLSGNWSLIESPFEIDFWYKIFSKFEPHGVISLLQASLAYNYEPKPGYLFTQLTRAIPFSQSFFDITQERWGKSVLNNYYPAHLHGWSNNIWGEVYSFSGAAGLLVFSLTWCFTAYKFQKTLQFNRHIWLTSAILCFTPQLFFFITRVNLGGTIAYISNGCILIVLIYALSYSIRTILSSKEGKYS